MIENAAREPELSDLADLLRGMGARVEGVGSPTIEIEGVHEFHAVDRHAVIPDRIEAGTFAIAACATGGRVFLEGARTPIWISPSRSSWSSAPTWPFPRTVWRSAWSRVPELSIL